MRPYKAAYDITLHKWYGLFYENGCWHEVRDNTGFAVPFNSWKEAIAGAKQCTTR